MIGDLTRTVSRNSTTQRDVTTVERMKAVKRPS